MNRIISDLKSYRIKTEELEVLQQKSQELYNISLCFGQNSSDSTRVLKSAEQDARFTKVLHEKIEIDKRVLEKTKEQEEARRRVEELLKMLEDDIDLYVTMRLRYLELWSWEDISEELFLDISSKAVIKRHRKALNKIFQSENAQ